MTRKGQGLMTDLRSAKVEILLSVSDKISLFGLQTGE